MDINQISYFYQKGVYNTNNRIVVIGDIHGDLDAYLTCLRKARIINENFNWIAEKTAVVQMGDVLDRKERFPYGDDEDSEFKIIELIKKLQIQSFLKGCSYHCLIGNHELMNIMGIFDYVSQMGIKHFGGSQNRYNSLKPGTKFTNYIACFWNPIIKINNFLFVHGGITTNISNNFNIESINLIMKKFLKDNININKQTFKTLFLDENSLLWNRDFSNDNFNINKLRTILYKYKCKTLIIGHTPQEQGINQYGNGLVWRVDSGMSKAFGNNNKNKIQILEIVNSPKINNNIYRIK